MLEKEHARQRAEEEMEKALAEAKATQDALAASIAAAWRQGSDADGKNYYYNYITGESSWTPPPGWKPDDPELCWVRNTDERGQVYYYNMVTNESRWLPPCTSCGCESVKWCEDCHKAYCDKDFQEVHLEETSDPTFATHSWSGVESSKEKLQRGEVYCCECKRRAAKRMCTTCWDGYCDRCFLYVHHVGALKKHESISYKKAKLGWYCIKAKSEEEKDYYVNGLTGDTSYEKPEELMSETEKEYYKNYVTHRSAAEEYVKKIDGLQYELEKLKYDRDMELANETIAKGTAVLEQTHKGEGSSKGDDTAKSSKSKGFSLFNSEKQEEYRKILLTPDDRRRGKARSDYIQSLLGNLGVEEDTA